MQLSRNEINIRGYPKYKNVLSTTGLFEKIALVCVSISKQRALRSPGFEHQTYLGFESQYLPPGSRSTGSSPTISRCERVRNR